MSTFKVTFAEILGEPLITFMPLHESCLFLLGNKHIYAQ